MWGARLGELRDVGVQGVRGKWGWGGSFQGDGWLCVAIERDA